MIGTPTIWHPPHRFVHVGYNPRAILPIGVQPAIEECFGRNSSDWFRYSAQNYLLWSNVSCKEIVDSIINIPGLVGLYVFACDVTPQSYGYMPKEFWDWVKKYGTTTA